MKNFEKLPVIFLVCAGRTGSGFLHSLLDSHREVLMLPLELKFYQMWERLNCEKIKDIDEMVKVWSSQSKLCRLKEGIHYGYEEGKNSYTNCDYNLFKESCRKYLAEKGSGRRDTFLAIHYAYAQSTKQEIHHLKQIIEFSANPMWVDRALEDFPQARFIEVVRDHRANYASMKQYYLKSRGNLIDTNAKSLRQKSALVNIIDYISAGIEKTSLCKKEVGEKRFYTVHLENLHTDLKGTMRAVAQWTGINFSESLTQSTLGGTPWMGNSSSGDVVRGAMPEITTRWKKTLNKAEILLIEYLFNEELRKHGYQLTREVKIKNRNPALLKCLLPAEGEFKLFISKEEPKDKRWKSLWRISPFLVFSIRLMRQIWRMPARFYYYIVSRYYIWKMIVRKTYRIS